MRSRQRPATPRCGWGWSIRSMRRRRRRRDGADLIVLCAPVGVCGKLAAGDGAEAAPRGDRDRCRVRKGRDRARGRPASAPGRAFHSRPSDCRHRAFGPRVRLCRAVRRPLVRAHAAGRHRHGGHRQAQRLLESVRQPRGDHGRGPPRHGAGHHQPCAASHRLQHRQHGAAPGARDRHARSSSSPPAASATSRASPPPIP